jgi:hypothetical protein
MSTADKWSAVYGSTPKSNAWERKGMEQTKLPGIKETPLTKAVEEYMTARERIAQLRLELKTYERALICAMRKTGKVSMTIDDTLISIDVAPEHEVIKCSKAK